MFLGNDLVHWDGAAAREKESLSVPVARFVHRVLQDSEQLLLDALGTVRNGLSTISLPRHKALWAFWAAKEAAFKAAVKADPALRFSPKSILVEVSRADSSREVSSRATTKAFAVFPSWLGGGDITRPLARGWARVQDAYYEILWEYGSDYVHALAFGPRVGPRLEPSSGESDPFRYRVVRRVEPIDCVHRASRSVRNLARELVRSIPGFGDNASELDIRRDPLPGVRRGGRLGPPVFFNRGDPMEIDLSMSHDGPWAAAAVLPGWPYAT